MDFIVFDPEFPPYDQSVGLLAKVLIANPRRLALIGDGVLAKDTSALGGMPLINHADPIKEEVLEWLAVSRLRAMIPGDESTFASFCDFIGLSPGVVRADLWSMLGPLWEAMNGLLENAYEYRLPLFDFALLRPGEEFERKVAFVERHKDLFRTSLTLYADATRELGADTCYWANHTIARSLAHPCCLNGDTILPEEAQAMSATGWTLVHLGGESQVPPEICDLALEGSAARVAMDLALALASASRVTR